MSDNLKSMLLISANWQGAPTIQLIPMTTDCPYVEVVFVPQGRALIVVSKIKEHRYNMIDKLTDDGQRIRSSKNNNEFKQQRVLLESFHEYPILSQKEMENFIEMVAHNPNGIPYAAIIDGWLKLGEQADKERELKEKVDKVAPMVAMATEERAKSEISETKEEKKEEPVSETASTQE